MKPGDVAYPKYGRIHYYAERHLRAGDVLGTTTQPVIVIALDMRRNLPVAEVILADGQVCWVVINDFYT